MPELPEVETIVRDLEPELQGRTIVAADVRSERSLAGHTAEEFARGVLGQRIGEVRRRAKYILVHFENGEYLVVHLAMTGGLMVRTELDPNDRHLRIAFRLDDGKWLLFRDLRRFGRLRLLGAEGVRSLDERLGPEPLDAQFTWAELHARLAIRRLPVKAALLDQALLAGLGNIYADEALFRAMINPQRPANSLNKAETVRLHAAIIAVLREAIEGRGTSFSDYRDGHGRRGKHLEALRVYRRTGLPCSRCGEPIQRLVIGGRSTHFCPRCQPRIVG